MNSAIERLLTLRVRDVMNKQVLAIGAHESLSTAAEKLIRHEITGLPVVNDSGQCEGVLSGTDFVRRVSREQADHTASATPAGQKGAAMLSIHTDNPGEVRDIMTPRVHSISPDASLMDAAREMCRHHIHRLVATDQHRRPLGIVSSLDIVAAMVQAIEQ
jgi:CBS domain-containing protein